MYAERELKRLDAVKAVVRRRIARRRIETQDQLDRVARPIQWVDRAYIYWQKAGPLVRLAAAPLGALLMGKLFGRRKKTGSVIRWLPTLWTVVQGVRQGMSSRRAG